MREMKDSGIEWIGEIPKDWQVVRLCYLIDGYKAGPFGSSLIMDKLNDEGDILVYTPEIIASNDTELSDNKYLPEERRQEMTQFFVRPGDIIFPIVGSLGRAMLIDEDMPEGIINQRLAKFFISSKNLTYDYFMWLFGRSEFYQTYIDLTCRGSIIVNLTKTILHDMPVLLPPVSEQFKISNFLDNKGADIDALTSDIKSQIDMLEQYKRSVITEAVTKGLNPDVEMKDSGVEWIGEIPKDWEIMKITHIADSRHPYSLGDGDHGLMKTDDYIDEGIPYIRVQNIGWCTDLQLDNVVYISEENNKKIKSSTLRPGDILFVKTGATIGKTGIVPYNIKIANTTSHVAKLTVSEKYNPKYILYFLSSQIGYKQMWDIASQKTTRPELSIDEIKTMKVIVPTSKNEQDAIVNYLDNKCSEIDAVITDKQAQLDTLIEYKKSLIYEYVTGKKATHAL